MTVSQFPPSADWITRLIEEALLTIESEVDGTFHPVLRAGLKRRMGEFLRDAEREIGAMAVSIETPDFLANAGNDVHAQFHQATGAACLKARQETFNWAAGKYLRLVIEIEKERIRRHSGR